LTEYKDSAEDVNIMGPFKVTEEFKNKIDALSKEELIQEVGKGERLSKYQGERFAYCRTRLEDLEQQDKNEQRQQDVSHKQEDLSLAHEANQISRDANKLSKIAVFISLISLIAAIIALLRHSH
jgi:hypothetical protein